MLTNRVKNLLDRGGLLPVISPVMSGLARFHGHGLSRIFQDEDVWIHRTSSGYFAYPHPYLRLDLARLDEIARTNFCWGYMPQPGDVVLDIGAGVGEETLTFSRAVGPDGKVISVEAHPRTFRCLEKLVRYNQLRNVHALHLAATEPCCSVATIEDSAEYLGNRLNTVGGLAVPAATVDAISGKLAPGRIDFLKMNIEGAERVAIQGMTETLKRTGVVCVSCHDFLAEATGDEELRTKETVRHFLEQRGFEVVTRPEAGLSPYLRDQIWGYNVYCHSERSEESLSTPG